ncbi:hypothetical protein GCM10011297_15150 [Bacterioplanes sanyensis]|uniref:translesion DNA synthesis-associated protein ImuA n=1 Tax=Bacterioplanes sanyensis TaxID=1249553 RepID=UPI0016768A08|nr:translesion DNA synthesis-associated protein ImuA [Bacterioplanes sanyensis]GGY43346.1 hypothetical protein GCM10011297_15150 [Bacterioplanes sanyensis]
MKTLQHMLQQGQVWQAERPSLIESVSSGYPALDETLPGGGWNLGAVHELYSHAPGQGELSLLLPALAQLSQQPRWIVWVGAPWMPNATALAMAGVNCERILLVHPKDYQQAMWSMEEALRSGHCSAVLGWPTQWHKAHIRRLQIAAAEQQALCWLWPQTPLDVSGSPAAIRLGVRRASHQQVEIECFKRRGGWPLAPFCIELPQVH